MAVSCVELKAPTAATDKPATCDVVNAATWVVPKEPKVLTFKALTCAPVNAPT